MSAWLGLIDIVTVTKCGWTFYGGLVNEIEKSDAGEVFYYLQIYKWHFFVFSLIHLL